MRCHRDVNVYNTRILLSCTRVYVYSEHHKSGDLKAQSQIPLFLVPNIFSNARFKIAVSVGF